MKKIRRRKKRVHRKLNLEERSGRFILHHDLNRCRHGGNSEQNLIRLDSNREKAWHLCFGNRTMLEVAKLLVRLTNMKRETDYMVIGGA